MTDLNLLFAVDSEKLSKFDTNFLKSKEGIDAISAGELKGEERLFLALLNTHLLNTTMFLPQKSLIKAGEQFDEAYFIVSGEVQVKQGEKHYKLGAGSEFYTGKDYSFSQSRRDHECATSRGKSYSGYDHQA